jgi:hypothetical protein
MMQELAQVILRPDDRLSDMQAIMEQTQAFENRNVGYRSGERQDGRLAVWPER